MNKYEANVRFGKTGNMSMTLYNFGMQLRAIDPLVHVEELNYVTLRVIPSHPNCRQALIDKVKEIKPIGLVVSVMNFVDDWNCTNLYYAKPSLWQKIKSFFGK